MRIKHSMLTTIIICISILIIPSNLFSANELLQSESGTSVQPLPKGVSIHQLDNGMQALLIENPALPMVGVNAAVKIGSAYETFSTSGMSHMLEHLLFNGTTTRTQKQLYDDVDRIGGYNNASTADFYTNYMMVMPTENTEKGMALQADMLFNSTLPFDKFEKEKGIVLEEISKSLANPQEQYERNTASILYNGHALSLPTLGTYSTIQSMKRDDVFSFYKNNYVPNNMILTAIGNFQTGKMLEMIKEIYGKAEPGLVVRDQLPEWYTGFQIPDVSSMQRGFIYNRFYDGKDISIQVFFPLPLEKSSEFFKLLNIVLEKNKDAVQNNLKTEFPDVVKSLRLSTRPSHIQNFVEAVVLVNKSSDYSVLINSISKKLSEISFNLSPDAVKSEVTKARTEFLKNIEKPHMFGIYNSNEIVTKGLESVLESYTGDRYYFAVKDLAALKLTAPKLVIIQTPSVKDAAETLEAKSEIKLFEEEGNGKSLIAVQNELSNLLAVHYLIKHKASYEAKYGKDAAKILHDCLEQRMKSEENQKKFSQFGFTFVFNDNPYIPMDDIYLHPDFGYIRAEGLADELEGAINFLNLQFKDFIPTEDEFKKAVEKFKGIEMMQMGGDKAKKLFDETYKPLIYEPEPYSADKPALTYDNLKAFTKEYFQPANMIISVVSPAPCDSVNTLFSEFRSNPATEKLPVYRKSLLLHENAVEIEKDGKGERSYLFWGFTTQIDPDDAPALQALSLILSDNIVFDIREKQGMAYHMSAGIEIIDDKALFYINQGTRPQNVDTLVSQYPGFFGMKWINELSEDELEKSINMYLGRMMFRRLSSINQAFYLGNSLYFNNDYNYDKNFHEKLKNVKLTNVKDAAKKYMNVKNPVLVVVR